jgi:hypothetical protein
MSPEFYPATGVERLGSSPIKFKNSGIVAPGGFLTLNTSESLNAAVESSLSDIAETGDVPPRYYLGQRACRGMLRRMRTRGKSIPELEAVLRKAAGE